MVGLKEKLADNWDGLTVIVWVADVVVPEESTTESSVVNVPLLKKE